MVLACFSCLVQGLFDVKVVKCLAILEAFKALAPLGFRNFIVESDALEIVNVLKSKAYARDEFGHLLDEIRKRGALLAV